MQIPKQSFRELVDTRFPGLTEKIKKAIEESERAFDKKPGRQESFLWEHTIQVASISQQLAELEKIDPLVPTIAALFHDVGKFSGGRYHENDKKEEETSAKLAERVLGESGMRAIGVRRVVSGLKALYQERARKNPVASIVHDADFLSKFGAMGVANFFIKSALRGRTLRSALLEHLSKDLTYAACLPLNMRTSSGKKIAVKKATDLLRYFRSLLDELREARIADLRIRRVRIPHPLHKNRDLDVRLIVPRACPECGGLWKISWTTEKGLKCHRLNIESVCRQCGGLTEVSFCLPEIAPAQKRA